MEHNFWDGTNIALSYTICCLVRVCRTKFLAENRWYWR